MKINKLSEYIDYVEKLPKTFTLSRGQVKERDLLPSALRRNEKGIRRYSKKELHNFMSEFKIHSYQYMSNPSDVRSEIEWMLYAQHYGLPTRLLDFTTAHMTSLLFSLETSFKENNTDEPVIYFLDPYSLNRKNKKIEEIIINEADINNHNHDGPIVIQGRKLNSRINAQKGLFVYFEYDDEPINKTCSEEILRKVTIDSSMRKDILSSLYSMGVSYSHVYPELSSVAKDIILKQDICEYSRDDE